MESIKSHLSTEQDVVGRLAKWPYKDGDPLPAVGSTCLVSGVNQDVESDLHRTYSRRKVIGYSDGNKFVCLQTRDCWPTVERLENCWFAEIQVPRPATAALVTGGAEQAAPTESLPQPIPMLLWCPECGDRHLDVGEFATKVHHTHACQSCGMVWRPAIGPTVGVQWLPGFKNER